MQSHETVNVNLAFIQIGEIFWSFALIFIYCEFGERVNAGFANLCDVIGQFNWCLLPINIQKLLPVAIGGVQRPINIQGYGNFPCNRKAFKNVPNFSIKTLFIFYPSYIAISF